MIQKLETKNFTVLRNAVFEFSPSMNVIIGENGSGKTHLLKLLYSILSGYKAVKCQPDGTYTKQSLQQGMADKLFNVFRPDQLGRLTTRKQGRERAEVTFTHKDQQYNCKFSFATNSKTEVNFSSFPQKTDIDSPIFFPAKELLTLFPNFLSMYSEYYVQYDETYKEVITLLGRPYLKGPREHHAKTLIENLESAIGGHIYLDKTGSNFYMAVDGGDMEINLVAEGWRKIGMLTQVVLNGALRDKGYFFWDEPEANLNPRLIKELAKTIFELSKNSQVFITTHSLFLLRELEYLSYERKRKKAIRYFSLTKDGIEQSDSTTGLTHIASFMEEISQEDRVLSYKG